MYFFSGVRFLRGSVKERERKKFLLYSVYAWGAPLIMLVVCLLMDLIPDVPGTFIKPEFGVTKCWFKSKYKCGVLMLLILTPSTTYNLAQAG